MTIKTTIAPLYRLRLGLLGLLFLGYGAWSLYDGFVTYPLQRQVRQEYDRFVAQDRAAQWNEFAAQRGWPDDTRGKPGENRGDFDIWFNRVLGVGLLPFGLLFAWAFVGTFNRWIALDDKGLAASGGVRVPFDSMVRLDKERWKSKGIAVVHYHEAPKQERRLVLDDWKFERASTTAILEQVESRLRPDQIVDSTSPATPTPPAS